MRYSATPLSFLQLILDVVEALLGLRFFLVLFGAHPGNWFSRAVYRITDPLLAPFNGIFPNTDFAAGAVEWKTIVAMVVLLLIGMLVIRLILLLEESIENAEDHGVSHRHY